MMLQEECLFIINQRGKGDAMPVLSKILIAGGAAVGVAVVNRFRPKLKSWICDTWDSFTGAQPSKKAKSEGVDIPTTSRRPYLKFDFWRKVIDRSSCEELISAMNALYPNGQTVSIEQVFSYAESGGLSGKECSDAISAVVAEAKGKLDAFVVQEGDRWDSRTMQSEDNNVPPAAYVSEVLSLGLRVSENGRVVVRAMVRLASKTDKGVLR